MRTQTGLPHLYIPVGRLWNGSMGNYDANRAPIDLIVIHTMQGTTVGTTAHFKKNNVSAHYGVSLDGSLTQWIPENNVSYHAGLYPVNQRSIGIEHEDGYNPQTKPNAVNEPRPDSLYETSSRLVADIAANYNIPLDRKHVVGHKEVGQTSKSCPGSLDIDRILAGAIKINTPNVIGEEPLVSHMMKPSVFASMVTKSTNWDEFCKLAGIAPDQASRAGMGRQVYDLVSSRLDPSKSKIEYTVFGMPIESATTQNPGSPVDTVINDHMPSNLPTAQSRNVWKVSMLDVIRDVLTAIKGKVSFT